LPVKVLLLLGGLVAALYTIFCGVLYGLQERLLFFPEQLPATYHFPFPGRFEERWTTLADGTRLHGLLFHAAQAKGLLFYLHGNGGTVASWGYVAPLYTALGYDVFLLDYRGYGKSGGHITSQQQLLSDVQTVYAQVSAAYAQQQTVILGYSLGTGLAAWLAAQHQPKLLVLQAPYYSMRDLAAHTYPLVPSFLVRYPLPTNEFMQQVKAPVVLFHGEQDAVIYPASSRKLLQLLKPTDRLIVLPDAGHNDITDDVGYQQAIAALL
jgi:alpha-beta hydrolase superfamily lysophospholipase